MAHHLSPNDVVPPLREDLEASPPPSGTGAEVITVAPVEGRGSSMRMHGFEFSIARMLDGRRTAEDVVLNCRRLGLPVNLDALEDFLFQLRQHGLLGGPPIAERRVGFTWTPGVRDLYRHALRAAREGEFKQARGYLDSLLGLAPGTIEAVRLRDWVDSHPDPKLAGRTFGEVFQRTLDSWAEERPPHWSAELRDSLRRSWWPVLGVLTAIGFLIAYWVLPNSHHMSVSAQLTPAAQTPIAAPVSGLVDQVFVTEGDRVPAGTPLFAYGAGELQSRLSLLSEELEATRAPLRAEVGKTADGAPLAAALKRAEQDLSGAQTDLLRGVPGASERYALAHDALQISRAELEARIPLEAVGETSSMDAEVSSLTEQIQAQTVKAPVSGTVTKLFVRSGQTLSSGQSAAQIEDTGRMKVVATVAAKHAKAAQVGAPITVKIGAERYHSTIEAVSGNEIATEIPNPNGTLRAGTVKVQLDLPPRGQADFRGAATQ